MKELTLKLEDKEFEMLYEITSHIIEKQDKQEINKSDMDEAIRALILRCYINEIVPIKYGKDAVVTVE
jgi:hypothetical protein